MDEKEWLLRVANEVEQFMATYGYTPQTFREVCGITVRQLKGIRQIGYLYFMPTEVYARLNWIIGIESADPTKIPMKVVIAPHGGVLRTKRRAWTTEEYIEWMDKQDDTFFEIPQPEPADSTVELHPIVMDQIGQCLSQLGPLLWMVINTEDERLLDTLAERFGPELAGLFALISALTLEGEGRRIAVSFLIREAVS